jgi:hypothetical protein
VSAAEKQRRRDKGLCGYCGGNHKYDDCSLRKKKDKTQGRAATVGSSSDASPPSASVESKK